MVCKARYSYGKSSVRPSVTLVDCDHTGWNSSKIISRLDSLRCSLSADQNIVDLLQREHPEILTGIIGEGLRKSGFRRTKAVINSLLADCIYTEVQKIFKKN